ncbi:hypothetical protein AR1Y2_0082 [Anaerostipes rhamnosivorans]|uniref:Uncharacterized protein n=1 Tax=Anaerostipes rhamnosivorans TaxID=1229621 RepID=A0A4P8I841_9FIRM|nr:hypothetical protein AR1Y2_0082 [Anaerostipes rhamnosivorans]
MFLCRFSGVFFYIAAGFDKKMQKNEKKLLTFADSNGKIINVADKTAALHNFILFLNCF